MVNDIDNTPGRHERDLPDCTQLADGIQAFNAREPRAKAYYRALATVQDH